MHIVIDIRWHIKIDYMRYIINIKPSNFLLEKYYLKAHLAATLVAIRKGVWPVEKARKARSRSRCSRSP